MYSRIMLLLFLLFPSRAEHISCTYCLLIACILKSFIFIALQKTLFLFLCVFEKPPTVWILSRYFLLHLPSIFFYCMYAFEKACTYCTIPIFYLSRCIYSRTLFPPHSIMTYSRFWQPFVVKLKHVVKGPGLQSTTLLPIFIGAAACMHQSELSWCCITSNLPLWMAEEPGLHTW